MFLFFVFIFCTTLHLRHVYISLSSVPLSCPTFMSPFRGFEKIRENGKIPQLKLGFLPPFKYYCDARLSRNWIRTHVWGEKEVNAPKVRLCISEGQKFQILHTYFINGPGLNLHNPQQQCFVTPFFGNLWVRFSIFTSRYFYGDNLVFYDFCSSFTPSCG